MNLNNRKIKERKTELSLYEKSIDDREEVDDSLSQFDTSEEWEIELDLYDSEYRKYLTQ